MSTSSSTLALDGGHRRNAAVARPRDGSPAWRGLIAWMQLLLKAFVQRCGNPGRWVSAAAAAAGRPVLLLVFAFLVQRRLRRAYLSRNSARQQLRAAAAVTVQAAIRAALARRELSLRRQARASVRIQAQWRAHRALRDYLAAERAAVICQCAWRRRAAMRQLGDLRMTSVEKARLDEICRLHEVVDVLQQAVADAELRVIAERKAMAEAPPVIKETLLFVEDIEKTNALTTEVERLKDLLGEEIRAALGAKKSLAEAELRSERLARLLGVEEVKNKQLQDSLRRMETKASDLDAENRMLRQAVASSNAPDLQTTPENEKAVYCEVKPMILDRGIDNHDNNAQLPGPNAPEAEKQQQELLIKCISEDLGFSVGRPIAAYLIYRCLVHWKSFEEDRTTVYDRIIQKISAAIEVRDNNDTLAYWLSNSCTLVLLLQKTLKINGATALSRQRRRTSSVKTPRENQAPVHPDRPVPDGRLTGGLAEVSQVEAKYPAIAFKQQLTALMEKVYGVIRNNMKKELSPLLGLCIQAPKTFVVSPRGSCAQGTDLAHQASMAHWQSIIKILTNSLNVLKSNYVPPFLICKLFTQLFSFINVQLFNSLLLRRECCSFSNGEYVKAGLDELEHWCFWLTEEYAGSSWDELKHIRQAVALLTLEEKHSKSLDEIAGDFCPALSMQQLYRISTMYCDDKYGTLGILPEVVSTMRAKMVEGSSSPSVQDDINSFLLDDDFSIPFTVDDIAKLMVRIDVADMDLPSLSQEKELINI